MPKANLPTPEDIAGQRSLSTPFTDLQAMAKPISNFQGATADNVGQIQPGESSLAQLSHALDGLNPALQNLGVAYTKKWDAETVAQAKADFNRSRKSLAEATEAGLIPKGYSRLYQDAYNATELDTRSMEYALEARKAYDEAGMKDNDNTAEVASFLEKTRAGFRKSVLTDKNGNLKYSDLDLANSKFDEQLQHQENSLLAQHNQYRAVERERKGEEITLNNISRRIDMMWGNNTPAEIAAAIKESVFEKGIGAAGVTKTRALDLITEALKVKAVEYGDPSVMHDIAAEFETAMGGRLSGRVATKEKFKQAEDAIWTERIRMENYNWEQRRRHADEANGLSPEDRSAREAQENQVRDEHEKAWKHERSKASFEDAKKVNTDYAVSTIFKELEFTKPNSGNIKKQMDWLRDNNREEYKTMLDWMDAKNRQRAQFVNTPESQWTEAQLRYKMSVDPMHFSLAEAMKLANPNQPGGSKIDPSHINQIADDWDKAKKTMDHPFMQNEMWTRVLHTQASAIGRDEEGRETPAGQLAAMKAEGAIRAAAASWIQRNPDKDLIEFTKVMREYSQLLVQEYSPGLAKDQANAEEARVNPKPVTPKDTRTTMEKLTPDILGGKPKPKPETPSMEGPEPMTPKSAATWMSDANPAMYSELRRMMSDPNADDLDIEAHLLNSGLWAYMKSNGHGAAEFRALQQDILKKRKRK